jgi:hypothetical protein
MAISNAREYYEYWNRQGWVIRDIFGNPLPGLEGFKAEFARFARTAVEKNLNMDTSFPIPRHSLSDNP